MRGLMGAFREEAAFRQELAVAVLLIPLGLWLGKNGMERASLAALLHAQAQTPSAEPPAHQNALPPQPAPPPTDIMPQAPQPPPPDVGPPAQQPPNGQSGQQVAQQAAAVEEDPDWAVTLE